MQSCNFFESSRENFQDLSFFHMDFDDTSFKLEQIPTPAVFHQQQQHEKRANNNFNDVTCVWSDVTTFSDVSSVAGMTELETDSSGSETGHGLSSMKRKGGRKVSYRRLRSKLYTQIFLYVHM